MQANLRPRQENLRACGLVTRAGGFLAMGSGAPGSQLGKDRLEVNAAVGPARVEEDEPGGAVLALADHAVEGRRGQHGDRAVELVLGSFRDEKEDCGGG